jgi:hypothetical protein
MSPYGRTLRSVSEGQDTSVLGPTLSDRDVALLEEMSFVRREAQLEADLAYEDWSARQCADSYAVYRAAQDRADAAQDDLADMVQLLVG